MRINFYISVIFCSIFFLASCVEQKKTQARLFDSDKNQAELKKMQTRIFDTNDQDKILKDIISTFQDLGFVIDKTDIVLGMVSATCVKSYQDVRMTVTIRPKGDKQLIIRANIQFGTDTVLDPFQYTEYFKSLASTILLPMHNLEE